MMAEPTAGLPVSRGPLLLAFAGWAAFLTWILLWPRASAVTWVVVHTTEALDGLGSPAGVVNGSRVEFALNAAMVAPLTLLAVLLWRTVGWERWTAYAFIVSCAAELAQALWLPSRSAQYVDVIANTLGAGVGAMLGHVLAVVLDKRRARTFGSKG